MNKIDTLGLKDLAPVVYSASGTTSTVNLPLFEADDHPTWLTDWNGAMNTIDAVFKNIDANSTVTSENIKALQTGLDGAQQAIQKINSNIDSLTETLGQAQSDITSNRQDIETIQDDLLAQNALVKTLSDTVVKVQNSVTELTSRVNDIEKTANTAKSTADTAKSTADTAKSTADTAKSTADTARSTADTAKSTADTAKDAIDKISGFYPIKDMPNDPLNIGSTKDGGINIPSGNVDFIPISTSSSTLYKYVGGRIYNTDPNNYVCVIGVYGSNTGVTDGGFVVFNPLSTAFIVTKSGSAPMYLKLTGAKYLGDKIE